MSGKICFGLLVLSSGLLCMAQEATSSDRRDQVVALAQSLTGIKYSYGGTDIDGFDCSGLVQYIFTCFGMQLPRSAAEIYGCPRRIKLSQAKPGDILVFKLSGYWHVALLISPGRFIHAPNRKGHVREEELNEYYIAHLKAVLNVID